MNRLFDIASELGEIARKRFDVKCQISIIDENIKKVEAAIVPVGGWPGSNADQRKASELAARSSNQALIEFGMDLDAAQNDLAKLEVDREVLIAERDAWMWTIRDQEQSAVHGFGSSVFVMMEKAREGKE